VAKEQGLRSRAAFKLTQINRKFAPLLEKAGNGAVLDLCAAPGGWTQIAARTCPKHCAIVAVDILPIRKIPGAPNVTTLVGDITTEKCKSDINRALGLRPVDVVLHDGAPNIGAEYSKDAYAQNELAVHALQCATRHLQKGGAFVTKMYRSRDYNAYLWVLQQLFDQVQAFKPKASRQQSAEIFLVALGYKAPAKLDKRFLDPRHVFASVEDGDDEDGREGGGENSSKAKETGMTIFHKNWEKKRKNRSGYDHAHLDMSMRHVEPATKFVSAPLKEAIQILSRSTGLGFRCDSCLSADDEAARDAGGDETASSAAKSCRCQFLACHPLTTTEIKECVTDLQVLNKGDFKQVLNWRTKMQDAIALESERQQQGSGGNADTAAAACSDGSASSGTGEDDSDKEERQIQIEIEELRKRRQRERKRKKKKEREIAMKRRRRAALGSSVDLAEDVMADQHQVFSLATIQSKSDLDKAAEVDLDHVSDDVLCGGSDEDEDVVVGEDEDDAANSDDDQVRLRRERELNDAYDHYLQTTKNGLAKSGTKHAKRSKKLQRMKVAEEAAEDQEMALAAPSGVGHDTKAYMQLLHGPKDSDDEGSNSASSDSEDDKDAFHDDPMTPEEHAAARSIVANASGKKNGSKFPKETNPLIHKFAADESSSAKTARWFSNPLFARIGEAAAQSAAPPSSDKRKSSKRKLEQGSDSEQNESVGSDSSDSDGGERPPNPTKEKKMNQSVGLNADEVFAMIPRTDKQVRHDRRLKRMAREERRKAHREQRLEDGEGEFELVPGSHNAGAMEDEDSDSDDEVKRGTRHLTEAQRKKVIEARELIRAGMGNMGGNSGASGDSIEVVPPDASRPLPIMDDRKYDSDHEDYDSDDYARTLALGTMMLRRSKEKASVDASYNRYAWNDPQDLPEWFVDDETRHYRPQLPIPPALVTKMKEKMMALSQKPIAKVAEARARKSKRAKAKLDAAKKKAEAVANTPDMSEASKLKAISKALRGQESKTKPGKTYVVAKKGRGLRAGAKGVKVVDNRLRSDKRAMERIEKKRKKGKQNGLVGNKKRHHHK